MKVRVHDQTGRVLGTTTQPCFGPDNSAEVPITEAGVPAYLTAEVAIREAVPGGVTPGDVVWLRVPALPEVCP